MDCQSAVPAIVLTIAGTALLNFNLRTSKGGLAATALTIAGTALWQLKKSSPPKHLERLLSGLVACRGRPGLRR
eukprot:9616100-Lingulodinium_polyedra.AAC.1